MLNFLKRWLQLRIIRSLAKSLPLNTWWLYGSWAREAIADIPAQPDDVDVYILDGTPVRIGKLLRRFLDINFLHQEDNLLMVEKPWEISSFPLEALDREPRSLKGIPVYTISPEFLYLQMSLSTKERHRQILPHLSRFVNHTKLERIASKVQLSHQTKER
ncbi:MAG: hypothetical protein COX38_02250 [Candidatus Nealsonbacteria bacterium CG23_combo_of_CG06-09_8_20_14_all_39_25]|uniref:Uncharacterized protein n=1 Tax=Candidatus Nealsonbacteria bacterium CG23_combo_of_CG06-09_8_20_14_all_39_25 TaxID=1974723 RepID=A0A2G9YSC6_9BACT|nr:MAG: hypothetical protein COX38_02250 [Candidatus Nealsonbacteria bacterium CG23_combo_of_CG06-09_8_20_14_all_39_25]